jgi:hypothetical protein
MRMRSELSLQEFHSSERRACLRDLHLEEHFRALDLRRADAVFSLGSPSFNSLGKLLRIAGPDQRQRVQNLLFGGAWSYDPSAGIFETAPILRYSACWKRSDPKTESWWAHQDLNLEPTDYESAALTN